MNSFEKLDCAISLKPASEIPVFPMIITFAGRCAGMTQAEIFASNKNWVEALTKTYEIVGTPDVVFPMNPKDVSYIESMRVRLPGRELGEEELFQFVEEEEMKPEEYDDIIKNGYDNWYTNFMKRIQYKPFRGPFGNIRVTLGFITAGMRVSNNMKYWQKRGLPLMFHSGCAPAFDTFSLSRSMAPFFYDLADIPDKVKQACDIATDAIIKTGKMSVKMSGGNRIAIFAMRSSATFVSPAMFEEFVFPNLKKMVESYFQDGIISVIHCDGNWTPMLPYFKQLPRGSCVIELDASTDIFKAKEILGDWQCIRGDVPATMLAFGKPEEVAEYCQKLVNKMGYGGGFILGSGCEVPLNAKNENVATLIKSVR